MLLLRHGATANNVAHPPLLQGRGTDPPLSEAGKQQAADAAEFLKPQPLAAIYSSPLARARQTAQVLADSQGLDVQTIDAILECDVGAWEGRSWQEISATEPEAYRRFMQQPDVHGYCDGENLRQVLERAAPALNALFEQHQGQVFAVVAHNVVNRVYLAEHLGIPIALARDISQENACVNIIRGRKGKIKTLTVNAAFHLQPV